MEAARKEAAAEVARNEAAAEMARVEAARAEAARVETARVEAAKVKAARAEVARVEAARKEAARKGAATKAAREEAERMEAARVVEAAEAARLKAARLEAAMLDSAREDAARAPRIDLGLSEGHFACTPVAPTGDTALLRARLRAEQTAAMRRMSLSEGERMSSSREVREHSSAKPSAYVSFKSGCVKGAKVGGTTVGTSTVGANALGSIELSTYWDSRLALDAYGGGGHLFGPRHEERSGPEVDEFMASLRLPQHPPDGPPSKRALHFGEEPLSPKSLLKTHRDRTGQPARVSSPGVRSFLKSLGGGSPVLWSSGLPSPRWSEF